MQLDPAPWQAFVDPLQIEHVLLNLAINARDAMPQGGCLTITTLNVSLGLNESTDDLPVGDYVLTAVRDTGTGMSDEVLRSAFEPFFTTKPPGRGSGLGLSQTYGLARQSGGGVRIDSKLGQGTTVNVFLPRAQESVSMPPALDGPTRDERRSVPSATPGERSSVVLVVDDEADVRATIAALVAVNGFRVAEAESGPAALRLIEQGLRFDLLLVDLAMPEMNGIEVARSVRMSRSSVPVVLMTGLEEDERIDGERWVLRKPFSAEAMTRMLDEALERAREPV